MSDDSKMAPGVTDRINGFLATGMDPNGYLVSGATLRRVILESGAGEETCRAVVSHLERAGLLQGDRDVDSLRLGIAIGRLSNDMAAADIRPVIEALSDLNRLPFVSIHGEPVS